MDRQRLDDVVALLNGLDIEPDDHDGPAPLGAWQELWRLAVGGEGPPPASAAACGDAIDASLGRPGHRLVAYGTLRPGEVNHGLVAGLGTWQPAWVRGRLGEWNGYPLLRPARVGGRRLPVMLLTSPHLPTVLPELDAFEGPAYRRAWVVAELAPTVGESADAVVARCYVDAGLDPG